MLWSPCAFSPFSSSSSSLNFLTMMPALIHIYLSSRQGDIQQYFLKIAVIPITISIQQKDLLSLEITVCGGGYFFVLRYNIRMSKVKVKFIYGGEHTVSVNETRNGPINWNNLADTNVIPEKRQITGGQHQLPSPPQKEPSIIQTVEGGKPVEGKTALNTYKSAETLPSARSISHQQSAKKRPVLNIVDADEQDFSQVKPQVKEPSIIPEKVERAREDVAIRAPSYKIPKNGGKAGRKEYIKGENTEKYLYSGLPEKDEDEFVGCFGCMRRKPKTYSVGKS